MRRSLSLLLAIVTVLSGAPLLHAQQPAQFLLAVTDEKGGPVPTFGPTDLEVFEDGKPAKVVKIEPKQSSLKVVLALDNGQRLADIFPHVKDAAREFVKALTPGTEIALVTTSPVPRFMVKSTKNAASVIKAIDAIAPESAPGRSIEAITDVADSWKKQPPGDLVLVLFGSTFVEEFFNKVYLERTMGDLKTLRAIVHVVMLSPSNATEGENQRFAAQQAALQTRGRFEVIGSYLQLSVMSEIAKTLAASSNGGQYLVSIERPAGATGKLGSLSLSPATGFQVGKITRLP